MAKPTELMTMKQVVFEMGCSANTLRRWIARGAFPAPAQILGRPRWMRSDIEEYKAKAFRIARTPRIDDAQCA